MGARHPAWLAALLFSLAFAASALLGWHLADRRGEVFPPPYGEPWQLRLHR